jgi:hypothetical protein
MSSNSIIARLNKPHIYNTHVDSIVNENQPFVVESCQDHRNDSGINGKKQVIAHTKNKKIQHTRSNFYTVAVALQKGNMTSRRVQASRPITLEKECP